MRVREEVVVAAQADDGLQARDVLHVVVHALGDALHLVDERVVLRQLADGALAAVDAPGHAVDVLERALEALARAIEPLDRVAERAVCLAATWRPATP